MIIPRRRRERFKNSSCEILALSYSKKAKACNKLGVSPTRRRKNSTFRLSAITKRVTAEFIAMAEQCTSHEMDSG